MFSGSQVASTPYLPKLSSIRPLASPSPSWLEGLPGPVNAKMPVWTPGTTPCYSWVGQPNVTFTFPVGGGVGYIAPPPLYMRPTLCFFLSAAPSAFPKTLSGEPQNSSPGPSRTQHHSPTNPESKTHLSENILPRGRHGSSRVNATTLSGSSAFFRKAEKFIQWILGGFPLLSSWHFIHPWPGYSPLGSSRPWSELDEDPKRPRAPWVRSQSPHGEKRTE